MPERERAHKAIVIRRLWWANLIVVPLIPIFAGFTAFGMIGLPLAAVQGKWLALAMMPPTVITFGLGTLAAINSAFFYRLEIDRDEIRIVGNLFTQQIMWSEVTAIGARLNFRVPGYHVHILVDGSNNPPRHWSNFWALGYFVHPFMQRGGKDLARYLSRKRGEWGKRNRQVLQSEGE